MSAALQFRPELATQARYRLEFAVNESGTVLGWPHWLDERNNSRGPARWLEQTRDARDLRVFVASAFCRAIFGDPRLTRMGDPGYLWSHALLSIEIVDSPPFATELLQVVVELIDGEPHVSTRTKGYVDVRSKKLMIETTHPIEMVLHAALNGVNESEST